MHILRSKDQLDIAQLRMLNHQALPIQMIPQYGNSTFTPNVSPMWGYRMDIPVGQGAGSEAMNKRSADQMAVGMDNAADIRGMIADAAKEFLGGVQQQQAGAAGQQPMAGVGGVLGQQGGAGVVRSTSPMGPGSLRHPSGQGNGMQSWAVQQLAAAEQQKVQAKGLRLLQEQQQQQQAQAMEQQQQAMRLQQQVQHEQAMGLQHYQQQAE